MLRRIFGSERDDVTGEWRRLHNEELHDLHSSPHIIWAIKIKNNEMDGVCRTLGDRRGAYKVLLG